MEVYKTDRLDLRNMDCMELMAQFPDNHFDLAVVDPPYRDQNQPTKDMRKAGSMKTLEGRPQAEYWNELLRVSKNFVAWGANNFEMPQWKGFVVWDKGIPEKFTMSMAEVAAISEGLGSISKIVKIPVQGQDRIHPTQKPVALYKWILANYAEEGFKLLDTHMGSGSIAIASHYANMHLTACELDEDYFKAACKRIKKETSQLTFDDWI